MADKNSLEYNGCLATVGQLSTETETLLVAVPY